MKTILTPFFLLLFISSSLFAQQEPVKLCAQLDKVGTDISVDVYVSDFVNIGSVQFGIAWEAGKYTFQSLENVNPQLATLAYNTITASVPDELSLFAMLWFDETGITPRTLSDETLLCTIKLSQNDPNAEGLIGIAPDEDFAVEFSTGYAELLGHELTGPDCSVLAFSSVTNTKDIDIKDLHVSPNPFNDEVTITLDEANNGSFTIYSVTGKLMEQFKYKNKQAVTLSLSSLDSGTYILTQKSEDGVVLGQSKIVKL